MDLLIFIEKWIREFKAKNDYGIKEVYCERLSKYKHNETHKRNRPFILYFRDN